MDSRTEAEILFPDRTLTLGDGRRVVVRELSLREAIGWQAVAETHEVVAACVNDEGFSAALALESLGPRLDWWTAFIGASASLSSADVGSLANSDAVHLAVLVMQVNASFFGSIAATQSRKSTVSPTPSPSSSGTDMPTRAV